MKKPLTHGFLPVGIKANDLENLTYGKINSERILIFFKALINLIPRLPGKPIDYTQWIPVPCENLNKIFGERMTNSTLELLEEYGYIEIVNHIFDKENPENNRCRLFRIPTKSLKSEDSKKSYKRVPIHDKKVFNAEQKYKQYKFEQLIKNCPDTLKRLAMAFQKVYLDLSSPAAKELIRKHKFHLKNKNGDTYLNYLRMLDSRDLEWYIRDEYGRLHYAWVNLNKKCNSLLRFKGYDEYYLNEIDIANSQPTFSALINEDVIKRLLPEALLLIEEIGFDTEDWKRYKEICLTGQFYEIWMNQLIKFFGIDWQKYFANKQQQDLQIKSAKYDKKLAKYERYKKEEKNIKEPKKPKIKIDFRTSEPRDAAKVLFYQVLFKTQSENDEVSNCFKDMLPDVWKGFKQIKSKYCSHNPSKKGSYTNLCWMIVKLEALVMIDTACTDLLDQGLIYIIPRHDSVLTPECFTHEVKKAIELAFGQLGLPVPYIRKK